MATQIGKLYSFNSQTTSITAYLEHVELYFLASMNEDGLRTAVLLPAVGSSNYELLRNLVATVSPKEKPWWNSICSHFSPKPLFIAEFHFCWHDQQTGESVAVYMA